MKQTLEKHRFWIENRSDDELIIDIDGLGKIVHRFDLFGNLEIVAYSENDSSRVQMKVLAGCPLSDNALSRTSLATNGHRSFSQLFYEQNAPHIVDEQGNFQFGLGGIRVCDAIEDETLEATTVIYSFLVAADGERFSFGPFLCEKEARLYAMKMLMNVPNGLKGAQLIMPTNCMERGIETAEKDHQCLECAQCIEWAKRHYQMFSS